jgi:hypothetical protein
MEMNAVGKHVVYLGLVIRKGAVVQPTEKDGEENQRDDHLEESFPEKVCKRLLFADEEVAAEHKEPKDSRL